MEAVVERGARAEWSRNWRVVVPGFGGIMLVSAHGHALGVMIRPLEEAFGWPRAQISAGFMFISVMALLVAPLVGRAVDRFGPRRIALLGVPVYCLTLSSLSLAGPDVLTWWALWFLVALGAMTILPVVWISVLNGSFVKSRGLAMAVALSGTGLGAAVFPYLTETLVESLGWRMAYAALAGICFLAVYPVTLLFFREGTAPTAPDPHIDDRTDEPEGPSARAQALSGRFFRLAAASAIFAVASCALTNNMVPVLIGEGLVPARAAATAGLLGIGSITGRLVGGVLLDRFDANKVAAASVLLPVLPVAVLLWTEASPLWAGIACLILGLSVGTELDACAYLVARHFGTRNFGSLFGFINGLLLFGAGLAPLTANHIYDVTRSYDLVLWGLLPLFVATALLFLSLGSRASEHPQSAGALPA